MQAPGGPEEDKSGGFTEGGWTFGYWDEGTGKIMDEFMHRPFELLLGRKTYEIFAGYWPHNEDKWPGINSVKKYVVSNSTMRLEWSNSILIKDNVVQEIKKLKAQGGPELQVYGSGNLIQTLLKHDLIDEYRLWIFPVTIGKGKKLFADGTQPVGFKLTNSKVSTTGVIFAAYVRDGKIKKGSFA